MLINHKASTKRLRVTRKRININKILVCMIIRSRKILRAHLKKKSKALYGYVHMYECIKHLFCSTYERVCAAQDTTVVR